jgi:hypothetical protein
MPFLERKCLRGPDPVPVMLPRFVNVGGDAPFQGVPPWCLAESRRLDSRFRLGYRIDKKGVEKRSHTCPRQKGRARPIMRFTISGRGEVMRWGLRLGVPLFVAGLSACWWGASPPDTGPRPYRVDEVHQPPKLLYCREYKQPAFNEPYLNAVQVEFDVTPSGNVINARIVEDGQAVSSSGKLGDVITLARSCVFTPGYLWGNPVAVRMSMWFVW